MAEDRLRTPPNVRRRLRQEACYGCCKCGHPILQYHHIVPYSEEKHFRPQDMMVLCPNHHDEATHGVLAEAAQRKLKANPYNRVHNYASGQLVMDRPRIGHLILGGCRFVTGPGVLIQIEDTPLLVVEKEGDSILLTAAIYDLQGNLLVRIQQNEWESHDPQPWDIEFHYRRLMVRSKSRNLSLNVDAAGDPLIVTGHFQARDATLLVTPTKITNGKATLTGQGTVVCKQLRLDLQTGIQIVPCDKPTPIPRIAPNRRCWCGSGLKFKKCHGLKTP